MFAKIILSCLLRIEATLRLKSTIELDIIPFDKLLYDPKQIYLHVTLWFVKYTHQYTFYALLQYAL